MNRLHLAILAAVPEEILPLSNSLPCRGDLDIAGNRFTLHEHRGISLAIGTTGVGKVNGAAITAAILARFGPVEIWNAGCSGAYTGSGLNIGDVLITSEWLCGDEGVLLQSCPTPSGNIAIPLLTRNGHAFFDRFSHEFFQPCRIAQPSIQPGCNSFRVEHGPSLTVGMVSGDPQTALRRFQHHRALAENMEGSAIAQTCLLFGAPLMECRGISNTAGVRDKLQWDFGKAMYNCHAILRNLLDSYRADPSTGP